MKEIAQVMGLGRWAFMAVFLAFVAAPVWAEAPETSIRPMARGEIPEPPPKPVPVSLHSIVAAAGIAGEKSIVVVDMKTGKALESFAPKANLPPASVTKAVTALYAFSALGPQWRFQTDLVATGPIRDGMIQGDLVLVGSGDPILDSDAAASMTEQLSDAGVTGITGKFLIWQGALPYQERIDPGQPEQVGYNPSLSGMNMNFNRVFLEWKRAGTGYAMSLQGRARKHSPQVKGFKVEVADRNLPIFTYKNNEGVENWTISRQALGLRGSRWMPVRNIVGYTGEVYRSLAKQAGIILPKEEETTTKPKGAVLARWTGASLTNVVRSMLKYSTNLTAEVVGLTTSIHRDVPVLTLKESAYAMTEWLNAVYGTENAVFTDHSGLGSDTRISAADMADILYQAGWDTPVRQVMKDVILLDRNRRAAPIKGAKVVAKTGTLNFASSLAGYIQTPSGRRLGFAIFTAEVEKRAIIAASDTEVPEGTGVWVRKSKALQQKLLRRWIEVFDEG